MLCIGKSILATLAYFDLFSYPLTKAELKRFLQQEVSEEEFDAALYQLTDASLVFKPEQFYSLDDRINLSKRRLQGNTKAAEMLQKAKKAAAIISRFPFVKGVAISGSLSKNYADELSDVDFFIITSANRLWLARSFLHLFKKLTFLFNKQHLFCMNYFIDEQQLLVPEKNIYTAIEIATLMPLYGRKVFEAFFANNGWTKKYLPNYQRNFMSMQSAKPQWVSHLITKMLDNKIGFWLDMRLMNMTKRSWDKKTKRNKKNNRGVVLDLDVSEHCARPNPVHLQSKLLSSYEQKLISLYNRYDVISESKRPAIN